MNTRIMVLVLGAALILGIGVLVATSKKPPALPQTPAVVDTANAPAPTPAVPAPAKTGTKPKIVAAPTPAPAPAAPGLSMAEIAKHNSRSSCWSAISGFVYDLTSWIPNHPGGEGVILSMCGKDGTGLYNGQHGGSSKPTRILGGFKLGELSK